MKLPPKNFKRSRDVKKPRPSILKTTSKAVLADRKQKKRPPGNHPESGLRKSNSGALFPIAAIGASAGGLEAFSELLRNLPIDTGMAFVCIQHLDPNHESILSSILAKVTSMPVREVENGMRVEPNFVYVIPPNTCMTIASGVLKLAPRRDTQSEINRPIDVFMRSLAQERGSQALGIVLSGTASDGSAGIEAIKKQGGITFAQEEKTAKFDQMPHNAIATGCVDFILSPEKIAENIEMISRHPHANLSEIQIHKMVPEMEDAFHQILLLLKRTSGVDFVSYKAATLKRRVIRRMVLSRKETLKDYLDFLKKNPQELELLHQDVLIKVTRFFRDPEIFKMLQKEVYPQITKDKSNDVPLRIWVPACSTGEEVYSLAIALLESLGDEAHHIPIQFFGSDIKESSIETARAAIYSANDVQDVSSERLRKFFIKVDRGYQITKLIRDRCIFAKQNVTADPPFSRIDLISCRNFLIYLTPALQKTVLLTFHYALKPGGFLLLGQSESALGFQDLFECINQKAKIYAKKQAKSQYAFGYVSSPLNPEKFPIMKRPDQNEVSRIALNAQREADRIVMAKFEQAGVVINESMEILQFRGDTSTFLKQAPGTPSLNLLKMAREGLQTELRSAVDKVRKSGLALTKENIRIKYEGNFKKVSIEVIPLKVLASNQRHFLISFAECSGMKTPKSSKKKVVKFKVKGSRRERELEAELARVKEELVSTKEYMQSIIEEREAANAELQMGNEEIVTSNEELQSMNEEMQSANEELQTAKEELQASNEEITTVNDELNSRNLQLSQLNDDFINLTKSIQLPVVIVGNDFKIRHFTPAAEKVFSLVASDVGRSISDIRLKVKIDNLEGLISRVIADLAIKEQEVQDQKGYWYNLQIRPYRTSDHKIDGVVITFVDIDALKKNQHLIEEHGHYLAAIIQTVSVPLLILDPELRVKMVNESFCRTFKVKADQAEGRYIYDLGNKQWDIPALRKLIDDILPGRSQFANYEVDHVFENIGRKIMRLHARQIDSSDVILLSIEDITEQKARELELRKLNAALEKQGVELLHSNKDLEQFASVASHDLQEPFHIISSFMGLLASGYKDKLEPKAQELIKIAEDASARAQNLIQRLLDYARLDSGERNFETVDMKSVVRHALSDLRRQVEESSMEIKCDPLPVITGDPLHLTRLFQSLISNCIKYRSSRPLKVFISARRDHEAWIFEVKDNGIGFEKKESARIFEMFKRLHGWDVSGVGIGLATSKKIVERHGGRIWAESEPDKGTSIFFSIPDQDDPSKQA